MNENIKFKRGDEIVAITNPLSNSSQHREKGRIYIVKDLRYCIKCGRQQINIGGQAKYDEAQCGNGCLHMHANNGQAWTLSHHFVLAKNINKLKESLVQHEEFEEAALIRDVIALM